VISDNGKDSTHVETIRGLFDELWRVQAKGDPVDTTKFPKTQIVMLCRLEKETATGILKMPFFDVYHRSWAEVEYDQLSMCFPDVNGFTQTIVGGIKIGEYLRALEYLLEEDKKSKL
jgi:hypothetical protein